MSDIRFVFEHYETQEIIKEVGRGILISLPRIGEYLDIDGCRCEVKAIVHNISTGKTSEEQQIRIFVV